MALKIGLRPQERVVIAGAVIRNGGKRCELIIENRASILREKDLMREQDADTPCKRVYFAVQLAYLDPEKRGVHIECYRQQADEILAAAPSMKDYFTRMDEGLAEDDYYQALRNCRDLIEYEKEVLSRV